MMKLRLVLAPLTAAILAACGGSQPAAEAPSDDMASAAPEEVGEADDEAMPVADKPAPATFAEQVTLGQEMYGANCAGCHGASGQGGDAPAVVGLASGALPLDPPEGAQYRKGQFKTVADIAEFVVATMPPKNPGSLTADEYWAILAFDLKANGIELDQKLTPELASTLEVPR